MISQYSYLVDVTAQLRINRHTGFWCRLPYPGHPDGCPQYGKRPSCPPQAPYIAEFIDLQQPHWFLIIEFDFAEYLRYMLRKHPTWSVRRLRCLLYWQGSIRKIQYHQISSFQMEYPSTIATLFPEAMGINIFATLINLKISFEKQPQQKVLKVALIGYPH